MNDFFSVSASKNFQLNDNRWVFEKTCEQENENLQMTVRHWKMTITSRSFSFHFDSKSGDGLKWYQELLENFF